MKYTGNDRILAQTVRLGDQIAVLFKQKKPLLLRRGQLERKRKGAICNGAMNVAISVSDQMDIIDRRLKKIEEKILPLERSCYHNYHALTGN
jgi:flagellar biosynthesis/type III secretory pathway chaperone